MLAAPTTKGFDLVAWIAPFAVFAAALLGTILLVRRWGGLGGVKAARAAAAGDAAVLGQLLLMQPSRSAAKYFAGRPARTEGIEP